MYIRSILPYSLSLAAKKVYCKNTVCFADMKFLKAFQKHCILSAHGAKPSIYIAKTAVSKKGNALYADRMNHVKQSRADMLMINGLPCKKLLAVRRDFRFAIAGTALIRKAGNSRLKRIGREDGESLNGLSFSSQVYK